MISIAGKEGCVGCNGCVQRCPVQCIAMQEDSQGFLYPKVDTAACIGCGLCEGVCPVINRDTPKEPEGLYAAWNTDESTRMTSSSGGVFFALAKRTIEEGGVVFGARFNERWDVVHGWADNIGGLRHFQGSKYVQSRIGDAYAETERFLKEGRKVLFSGTPCQIAGLRHYLMKDYGERLLTADVVCHGVPSPLVWRDYLRATAEGRGNTAEDITGISFRDKRDGWERYGMSIIFHEGKREEEVHLGEFTGNLYMQGFLNDLYLRPSCYVCPAKCGRSHSDVTLGDFWGIGRYHPELHSDKGVSLVLANTAHGSGILRELGVEMQEVAYEEALSGNPAIIRSARKPRQYSQFWQGYGRHGLKTLPPILERMKPTLVNRMLRKLKFVVKRILGEKTTSGIKSRI